MTGIRTQNPAASQSKSFFQALNYFLPPILLVLQSCKCFHKEDAGAQCFGCRKTQIWPTEFLVKGGHGEDVQKALYLHEILESH